MKYSLLAIGLLFCFFLSVEAQDIQVASFKHLLTDSELITNPVKDINGKNAALIKVVTTEQGFAFDVGALGLAGDGVVQKVGEIWVYVPAGTRKITINHQKLGSLRDYLFEIPIKSNQVYEMRLITGKVRTIVEEEADGQFWSLNVSPQEALVAIDEGAAEMPVDGVLNKLLAYGKHTYSITAPLYQPTGGVIEIGREKVETSVSLVPAYGFLKITTEPESGTDIYIDDVLVGKSPLLTERLPQGKHRLRAMRSMFEPVEQVVVVPTAGDTLSCPVILSANFAEVNIVTVPDATIYINDENRGSGSWSGRLLTGRYKIEAKKNSHRTVLKSIDVKKGEDLSIQLDAPQPIYGKLQTFCGNISGVEVLMDGKKIGEAPDVFSEILIGSHNFEMKKEGYKSYNKELVIEEGRVAKLEHQLEKELYGELQVTTTEGATLMVDYKKKSGNRFSGKMKAGDYDVVIKYKSYASIKETVTVKPGVENKYDFPLKGKVVIHSKPEKAEVYVDNDLKGVTPVELSLLGVYEVELKKEDYFSNAASLDVSPRATLDRTYELKKRPKKLYTFLMYVASPTAYAGGMAGICRSWGWYAKAQFNKNEADDFKTVIEQEGYYNNYGYESKSHSLMNITTGPMVRITKWLFAYAGAGYGEYGRTFILTHQNGDPYDTNFMGGKTKGISVEGGLIFRWKFLAVSGGFGTILGDVPSYDKHYSDVHMGLGFAF